MHSAVGRLWTLFGRTLGKWEGTWCAYCAGYVTHNAGDAHPTRLDQASTAAGMSEASARSSVRLAPAVRKYERRASVQTTAIQQARLNAQRA